MSKAEIEFAAENAEKMNDLISRSAALEMSFTAICGFAQPARVVTVYDINRLPPVDAVIPVFCKDCQSSKWDGYAYRCINPHGLRGDVKETDYCPRGIARCSHE